VAKVRSTRPTQDPQTNWGTLAVRGGEPRRKSHDSPTTPIVCAATYAFADTDELSKYFRGEIARDEYGRYGNPTVRAAEEKLSALEDSETAALFPSGMAAVTTTLLQLLKSGDHVVLTADGYRRTRQFVTGFLSRLGVEATLVEPGNESALHDALRPGRTRVILAESPTNPYLRVPDLAVFARARDACPGAVLIIDATFATPINHRPLDDGADLVIHSATKYLAGHNDLLAGAICGPARLVDPIRDLRGILGCVSDPHSAFLLVRGLKTLPLRVERQNRTALEIARFLERDKRVRRVFYPGLQSHPDHEVAKRQMSGFGGVVSFRIHGDLARTSRVVDSCQLATIAPSLGAVETLIEQPAVISFFELTTAQREAIGITDDLIRLSVGLEDPQDLIADLSRALDTAFVEAA
jgi:cystathionine gamma-synthase